jgi:hypothetical protein
MKRKNFIQSSIGVLTAFYLPDLPKISIGETETLFLSPAFLKPGMLLGSLLRLVILPVQKFSQQYKKWKAGAIK